MPRIFENVDRTPAQSESYAWLYSYSGKAFPVTPTELARMSERRAHEGNVKEARRFERRFAWRGVAAAAFLWLMGAACAMAAMMLFVGCTKSQVSPSDHAAEPSLGYYLIEDGRIVYANGRATGITLPDPVTGEPLCIRPGAVAAWAYLDDSGENET